MACMEATEDMGRMAKKRNIKDMEAKDRLRKATRREGMGGAVKYTSGELVFGDFYGNQFRFMRTLRAGCTGEAARYVRRS